MDDHNPIMDQEPVARAVLEYLNRPAYRPIPQRELFHRTHVSKEDRPRVRRLIARLIAEGRVRKIRGGRLVAMPSDGVTGILQRHREGYAFVVPETDGEDVFIPPQHVGDAFSGDRVTARITGKRRDGRLVGVVSSVLEARSREVLGVFLEQGNAGVVQPFDPSVGVRIRVRGSFRMGAKHMHAVRAEMVRGSLDGSPVEGKILELLGHMDEPGTDVLIVARKYGLATEFPPAVPRAANRLRERASDKEAAARERFDKPAPVTIDGETAQDFDDAVAAKKLPGGGFRLFVHIADVAHYVRPGTALDQEARHRGTSVYFPHRVLPMLPEALSNDLCSLRPDEDRLVQSVIIDFDARGKARKTRFADGIIRSAARLTYEQVAGVLEGSKGAKDVPARLLPMLRSASSLSDLLSARRHERGSLDFDLPEPRILLDVEGVMTGITIEPRNKAHLMIEEFMLAANEAVAGFLEERGKPCVYRVHAPPDPAKLDALANFVEGFGLSLDQGDGPVSSGQIQKMIEQVEGRPEYRVISQVALRSMKQARYTPANSGHFGLAAPTYCHFTSPIRRYPDLMTHRLLRAARNGHSTDKLHPSNEIEALSETSSELERNAESAERELLVWKKVAFIEKKVGEEFAGIVTGVARFGLFVQLVDNLVEGLIRVDLLGEDWFEHDESRFELRGRESGKVYKLGDRLDVTVEKVDRMLQRVDLAPVEGTLVQRRRRTERGRENRRGKRSRV